MNDARVTIMLKTRCGCTRIVTTAKSLAASGYYFVEFIDDAFSYLSRREFMGMTTEKYRRRFDHRDEFDKATGLPIFFEEGYYA